jgi:alkylation response protein AidB-like acyl-CoA dehydrogenase
MTHASREGAESMSPDPSNVLDSASDHDFRATARNWLAANVPTASRPKDGQALVDFDIAWQRRQFEAGWAGIDWPSEFGGRGLTALEQVIWYEELARAGAPHKSVLTAGLHQIGQTLMLCGSFEQKERYLPGILDGSVIWCQGFSEPDAGSDLASLRTSAAVVDDELVINGSKVWCSFGPYARMQGALVRTDPHASRHRGLSWVIVDLTTPGVTVRPIETIDGNAEFAEVFYDDVRIPLANVVGELHKGWQVALSTLALERGPAFLDAKLAMLTDLDSLAELGWATGLFADTGLAREFAEVRAGAAAIRAMAYRLVSPGASGGATAAAGTSFSLHSNELRQRLSRLAVRMVGAGAEDVPWARHWLNDFCATIAGGTSDIQRNVIGERVLGLPR